MRGSVLLCALALGAAPAADAASCSSFDQELNFPTTGSGNQASLRVRSTGGVLASSKTASRCGFPGAPGPASASVAGDWRATDRFYGDFAGSLGDVVDDPYGSDVIWGFGSAFAEFGLFRAHAVTHYEANGQRKGLFAGASAVSRDTFTIEDPTKTGEPGALEIGVFLSGGVRLSNVGPDDGDTTPSGGGSLSVEWVNSQNAAIDTIADVSRQIKASGTTDTVAADSGSYQFVYGEPFLLRTSFSAGANADATPEGSFREEADVTQSIEANYAATGHLGFVLPAGATLSAESGYGYLTASDYDALAAMIDGSGPPTTAVVPVPPAGWMLLSGLALLAARGRARR